MKLYGNVKDIVKSSNTVIKLSWRYGRSYFCYSVPRILLNAVSPFILVYFPKWIIDAVFNRQPPSRIIILVLLMFACRLLSSILSEALSYRCSLVLEKIVAKMRLEIVSKTMRIKYEYLENPRCLDLKERALKCVDDQSHISQVLNTLPRLLSAFIQIVGLTWILQQINIWIIVIMLAVITANTYIKSLEARKTKEYRNKFTVLSRKLFSIIHITWDYKYAKDIRIFQLKNWLSDKKQMYHKKFSDGLLEEFRYTSKTDLAQSTLNVMQSCLFYAYLVYKYFKDRLTLGDFSMYLSAINNFSACMNEIMSTYSSLYNSAPYIGDYINYMELKENSDDPEREKTPVMKNGVLEFCDVYFKYPDSDHYVLKGLSFRLREGEKLSVVGDNGAGKTTLIKLMLRLYSPSSGKITFNGIDISAMNSVDYSKLFGTVFQDYRLFAFTVAENIGYGKADAARVRSALQKVNLEGRVDALPQGMDTYASKEFSKQGIEFSGGEQQKIAIARALYKDSSIVILDEPTSNLSPSAEYELYRDFDRISDNKTVIYISHRMSSCRLCDHILLLQDGRALEYGSHEELMKLNGKYRMLYNIQAAHYV